MVYCDDTCVLGMLDLAEYTHMKYVDGEIFRTRAHVTAKNLYLLTHNSPVHMARSHSYKGLSGQLDMSQSDQT